MLNRRFLFAPALILCASSGAQVSSYTFTNVGDGQDCNAVSVAGLSDTGFVTGWVIPTIGSPLGNHGFRWGLRTTPSYRALLPE